MRQPCRAGALRVLEDGGAVVACPVRKEEPKSASPPGPIQTEIPVPPQKPVNGK